MKKQPKAGATGKNRAKTHTITTAMVGGNFFLHGLGVPKFFARPTSYPALVRALCDRWMALTPPVLIGPQSPDLSPVYELNQVGWSSVRFRIRSRSLSSLSLIATLDVASFRSVRWYSIKCSPAVRILFRSALRIADNCNSCSVSDLPPTLRVASCTGMTLPFTNLSCALMVSSSAGPARAPLVSLCPASFRYWWSCSLNCV